MKTSNNKPNFKNTVNVMLQGIDYNGSKSLIIGLINTYYPLIDLNYKLKYLQLFKDFAKNKQVEIDAKKKKIILLGGLIDYIPSIIDDSVLRFFDQWKATKNLIYLVQLYGNRKFLICTYGEFADNTFMYSLTTKDFKPYNLKSNELSLDLMYTAYSEYLRKK